MSQEPSTPKGIVTLVVRSLVFLAALGMIFTFVLMWHGTDAALCSVMATFTATALGLLGATLNNTRSKEDPAIAGQTVITKEVSATTTEQKPTP